MKEEHFTVATVAEFAPVIKSVLEKTSLTTGQASVVTLTGDLGAGKTTFTQQLAKQLGITNPVVSPTFGIMKGYGLDNHPDFDQLIHIDAYRIERIDEVGPLRFEELFKTPRTLICLEWPEKIADIIPDQIVSVTIEIKNGDTREVSVV